MYSSGVGSKNYLEWFDEGYVVAKPHKGPKILFIELTSRCNLNCRMCYRNSWGEYLGDMSEKLFTKVLSEAEEAGVKFIWFAGWGEPLFHPKFIEFVEAVKERGFSLGVNTNGLLLNRDIAYRLVKAGIDRLTVSIDAASLETYSYIRGGELTRILRSLKFVWEVSRKLGRKPILEFSYVLMRSNMDELIDVIELAEKYGVGRVIVSNIIPVTENMVNECIYNSVLGEEVSELISRAAIKSLETNVSVKMPEFTLKTERKCLFVEKSATCVTWDGKVAPCYNFLHNYTSYIYGREKKIKQVCFGNLKEEKLVDIWHKYSYVKFRYRVRFFRYPSCTDCRFHEVCHFAETNQMDCWSNEPSCADCLYSRGIVQCPV